MTSRGLGLFVRSCLRTHIGLAIKTRLVPQSLLLQTQRNYAKGKDISKDKKRDRPKVLLSSQELASVIDVDDFNSSLDAILGALKESYIKSLNIRAGVGIESLQVTFDGDVYPLKELATISKKGSNLMVLNLSSLPDAIKPVLEAIYASGMNVNPQQEGTLIYLPLPRVTREHREILAKNARTLFIKSKDEVTKVQNLFVKKVSSLKGTGYSDDLIFNACENIRFISHKTISDCEVLCQQKTKELLGD